MLPRDQLNACVSEHELERIKAAAARATAIVKKVDHCYQAHASLMMDVFGSGPTDAAAIAAMRENLAGVLVAYTVCRIEWPVW